MRKFIYVVCFFLFHSYALAQPDIVQGPFKLDNDSSVYIKKEIDIDYPLALYFESNGKKNKVESYEVDGSDPHVETMFFADIDNQKNVIVLISWKQRHPAEKVNGTSYQVYAYTFYSKSLSINPYVRKDQNLNGLDGEFDGEELHFKYKNEEEIKKYINKKYNN